VYIDLPGDVLYREVEDNTVAFPKMAHSVPRVSGDPDLVKKAIAILKDAKRPVILTGTGILWSKAMAELKEFVELSGIPFYTTPQGRGVIEEDHKLSFLGARNQAWKEADVALIVGTRMNFIIGFGQAPRWAEDVKILQVDISDEGYRRRCKDGVAAIDQRRT
jgi:thiamine pyrophosphate-dependent acetolactate synthase large subunit-like protein